MSDAWPDVLAAAELADLNLTGCPELVVVVAHPDDETLGAGGLLTAAADRGIRVEVVVATDGEASHPGSVTHDQVRIVQLRREEVQRAVDRLAPGVRPHRLGLPDGGLAGRIPELTDAVAGRLRRTPGAWVVSTWAQDGHPDHEAVGTAAASAAALLGARHLQFPLWAWEWTGPADRRIPLDRLVRFPLTAAQRARKAAAVAEYESQQRPLSDQPGDEAVVTAGVLGRAAWPAEYFVVTRAAVETAPLPDTVDGSLSADFFAGVYTRGDDPYRLDDGSWYERRKRALTLAALPRERFRSAFEPGCSIGRTTLELAGRCDRLLAADTSDRALVLARERLAGHEAVTFERRHVPAQWPGGEFDLVVVSEFGYYLADADLATLVDVTVQSLAADGVVVVCHWRHPVAHHPSTAEEVHRRFGGHPDLRVFSRYSDPDFLLDVLVRPPVKSIAKEQGLR